MRSEATIRTSSSHSYISRTFPEERRFISATLGTKPMLTIRGGGPISGLSATSLTAQKNHLCDAPSVTLPPEPSSPPLVQTLRWAFRPIPFMEDCRRQFGDSFGVRFLGFERPMVLISD